MSNELLQKAVDEAEKFCQNLSFEFWWDFAEVDKEKLRETVELCFLHGYLKGHNE